MDIEQLKHDGEFNTYLSKISIRYITYNVVDGPEAERAWQYNEACEEEHSLGFVVTEKNELGRKLYAAYGPKEEPLGKYDLLENAKHRVLRWNLGQRLIAEQEGAR